MWTILFRFSRANNQRYSQLQNRSNKVEQGRNRALVSLRCNYFPQNWQLVYTIWTYGEYRINVAFPDLDLSLRSIEWENIADNKWFLYSNEQH